MSRHLWPQSQYRMDDRIGLAYWECAQAHAMLFEVVLKYLVDGRVGQERLDQKMLLAQHFDEGHGEHVYTTWREVIAGCLAHRLEFVPAEQPWQYGLIKAGRPLIEGVDYVLDTRDGVFGFYEVEHVDSGVQP